MDFGRAFTYITEDEDWLKKMAIGAVLLLTGVGSFALIGWMIEIVRRVADNDPEPLPGWESIGDYFMGGIRMFVVALVWSLPIILVSICFSVLMIMGGQQMDSDTFSIITVVTSLCIVLLALVYSLILMALYGPLMGQLADGREMNTLFSPAPSYALLRANLGGYVIAVLAGSFIASILASFGTILCGIGALFGATFGYAVFGHLVGQAHAQARGAASLNEVDVIEEV